MYSMDKNEIDEIINKVDNSKILEVKVKEELEKSFIAYAMAVNVSRAIPDVRDGLKPVHRRILYAMGEINLFSDKPYKKCARIVGDVMGKYHPHGDSAIYDALVRLAQDFSINCPLVDGHGNFGSVDGDSPAAMRYTEARLSKIANLMLDGIDKETVDFYPNFDESEMQPTVLPSRFPNLLVNGSDGIAVGMATNIPPHNLCEVINGVIALIDCPDITIDQLMRIIPAPDFPTKGIVLSGKGIRSMYETGRGSFVIRSKADIEELPNGRSRIVVSEIPYQVNKANLIIQIADLVKNKKIEGISDIKEESDRQGMRIVIDVKKDANAQVVLNHLYKQTQMQISFGAIMLALADGVPKVLNLKEMLSYYLLFQKEVIIRRTKFDLNKAEAKAHILEGLVIAQAHIDEVIRQIKLSNDRDEAVERLTRMFNLSEKQANAILDMRLQKLTGLEVEKLEQDLREVHDLIARLKEILSSDLKVYEIIKGDLIEIKTKYGVPRKSEISFDYSDIDIEDLIEEETVVISLTHGGYIKRMPADEYKSQHRGGMGVIAHKTKEEDFVQDIFVTSTHDNLLCFSNAGKVYAIKGYEIPVAQKQSKGRAIINLLQLSEGERITTIIPISKDSYTGNLVMATKNGLIKKTPISEFESIRKGGKIAIRLVEDDELISIYRTNGDNELIMATSDGKCIRFSERNVRAMGRDTMGVRSVRLNAGETVVDMSIVKEGYDMITITENGYGKRSDPDEYRLQSRGGKGVKAGVFNEVTGKLLCLKQVTPFDDIMLIANDGVIIRISVREISRIGRNTKGVRIMKLKDGAKIVSVAVTPSEEAEENLANAIDEVPQLQNARTMEENLDMEETKEAENYQIDETVDPNRTNSFDDNPTMNTDSDDEEY